jgi:hypothetical protein
MKYNESLEKHVEELQEKLTQAETTIDTLSNPYVSLSRRLQDDDDYAWTFHCNIAVVIKDVIAIDHTTSNEIAVKLMSHLFGAKNYTKKYEREIGSS